MYFFFNLLTIPYTTLDISFHTCSPLLPVHKSQVLPHTLSPKSLPCPLLNPVSDTNMNMDVGHPLDHCRPTRYPTTLKETDISPLEASIVNST